MSDKSSARDAGDEMQELVNQREKLKDRIRALKRAQHRIPSHCQVWYCNKMRREILKRIESLQELKANNPNGHIGKRTIDEHLERQYKKLAKYQKNKDDTQ